MKKIILDFFISVTLIYIFRAIADTLLSGGICGIIFGLVSNYINDEEEK